MSLILNIETATNSCSVALAEDGQSILLRETVSENSHSSLVTTYIEEIIKESGLPVTSISAIAVSKGPGSYTGLRIGVSTAKGLSFAIDKPLVGICTLTAMTKGLIDSFKGNVEHGTLYCPMIDARRMEVYTAVYDCNLNFVRNVSAEIVGEDSFKDLLENHRMIFFGDGARKCRGILEYHENALFREDFILSAENMTALSYDSYKNDIFEDIAYFEPYYLKDFIAGMPKVKGLR